MRHLMPVLIGIDDLPPEKDRPVNQIVATCMSGTTCLGQIGDALVAGTGFVCDYPFYLLRVRDHGHEEVDRVAYLALVGSAAVSSPDVVSLDDRVAVLVLDGVRHGGEYGILYTGLGDSAM